MNMVRSYFHACAKVKTFLFQGEVLEISLPPMRSMQWHIALEPTQRQGIGG
jgi:hypothetical protein